MQQRANNFKTIGEQIRLNDYSVTAYCNDLKCNHSAPLDLNFLATKLGLNYEFSSYAINPLLRCTKCGRKNASIRISPRETEHITGIY